MSISNIINTIDSEIKMESKVLSKMNRRFDSLPPGSLQIKQTAYDQYYYHNYYENGVRKTPYIDRNSEKGDALISELLEKSFIRDARPVLKNNLEVLKKCRDNLQIYDPLQCRFGNFATGAYYLDDEICLSEWKRRNIRQNPFKRDALIHKTKSGIFVRSKSEVLIANHLTDNGYFFKSDSAFRTKNTVRYPDFSFVRRLDRRLMIWEHFGMLSDARYAFDCFQKLYEYEESGFVLGDNLIITFETPDHPLTEDMIDKVFRKYKLHL